MILKELGVKSVVVKAKDQLHGKVLGKVGADRIVYPERDMGMRIANNLISSNVLEYIELAPNYSVVEIAADENMYNKNLLDLQLRSRFGVNVMAIKSQDGIDISPRAESKIKAGDTLIVMGDNDSLDELRKM